MVIIYIFLEVMGLIMLHMMVAIFRVCMAEDPSSITSLYITENLKEAYKESDDFTVYEQTVYDMFTEDGVFYSTGMYYCPAAEQVQVSIRYNVRTMTEALIREELGIEKDKMITDDMRSQSKYGSLTSNDVKKGEFFAYRLVDDNGNVYKPATVNKTNRLLYVYYTFTFEGVETEGTNLYIELYTLFDGEANFDKAPVGRMKILSSERTVYEYELSGSEEAELSR